MFPAAAPFPSTQLPQLTLQNNFVPGSSPTAYGPHPQPGYLSQALLHTQQDPLHQGADPNSPEVFKDNIRAAHQQVLELQTFARRVLLAIQNAYQSGNSPTHTEADISTLKQMLSIVIEKLRQSGVGALPIIPPAQTNLSNPNPTSEVPTEKALLDNMAISIRAHHEKLQKSQDSAAVVANLLMQDVTSTARTIAK